MKWKTNARYNQPVENGTIYTCENNKIQVHKYHGLEGWFLSCHDLGFNCTSLKGETFEQAVESAKFFVEARLKEINEVYDFFVNDDTETEIVRYL